MAKDFLDRLGRTLKEGARVVARESEELARVAKLRLDMAGLAGKRDDLWEEIGKTICAQYEEGREVPAEVMDLCRRAQEITEKIRAKEVEIAALRAQEEKTSAGGAGVAEPRGTQAEASGPGAQRAMEMGAEVGTHCPQCGGPVEPEDRFCRQCGAALK